MALGSSEAVLSAFDQYSQILLVLPHHPSTDAITAGLALFSALEKKKKRVSVVSHDFSPHKDITFLPRISDIQPELKIANKFIISVDLLDRELQELNYDIEDKKLNIFITPNNGSFEEKNVHFTKSQNGFELVVIIDSPDFDHLGPLYEKNTDFFYKVPVMNIDHKSDNEHFGQINLVDIKANSVSEMMFELIQKMGDDILDEDIATNLLTGIIAKTKSFQIPTITPRSLSIASQLVALKARRDEIMQHLYHSKPLHTLKLWGRVLARLQVDEQYRVVWSLLAQDDFVKSGATEEDLDGIIDELIVNSPFAEKVAILYESKDGPVKGLVHTPSRLNGMKLLYGLEPQALKELTTLTVRNKGIREVEEIVLQRLREEKISSNDVAPDSTAAGKEEDKE